jgi:circadian clock protein KaiC
MKSTPALERMRTGIRGLDETLGGGLPRGRTSLVVGSTGAGKTIFAIQALAHGVALGEPGILVTFEESPKDLMANMAGFAWAPSGRAATRLCVIDGRELRTASRNGSFDLVGLLAAIEHRCRKIKARRIAFDGLDVLLDMIDDPAAMRREVYRLSDWLAAQSLTAIITAKRQSYEETLPARYDFLPFLTDCVILLQHRIVGRTASRALRVLKCRGVAHTSNEMPLVLTSAGIELDAPRTGEMEHKVFLDRISTGVARLDTMLHGGYLRGTCTLISGAPGTSKTSLAGAFAEAACDRGERTLFVSFDEAGEAIARNLASVNIRLERLVRSGVLRMFSVAAHGTASEAHSLRIASLLNEHSARCLVIDPVSAIIPTTTEATDFASDAVLGLLDLAKRRGVTVLLTSLLEGSDPAEEKTAIGISTIADTWMHLSYVAAAGERNRALTIVKSRGTGHANQVRELILSSQGLSLVDVYTAGGAVLMGTLRRQKEEQERAEQTRVARVEQIRHEEIGSSIAETQVRVASLRADVGRKKAELRFLKESSHAGAAMGAANLAVLRRLRGADQAPRKTRRSDTRPALRRSK